MNKEKYRCYIFMNYCIPKSNPTLQRENVRLFYCAKFKVDARYFGQVPPQDNDSSVNHAQKLQKSTSTNRMRVCSVSWELCGRNG